MPRSVGRTLVLAGAAVALAGPLLPSVVGPDRLRIIGPVWLAVTVATGIAVLVLLHRKLGIFGLALGVGIAAGGFALLGGDWSGALGTQLPCRHNWRAAAAYLPRLSPLRSLVFTVGDTRVKVCYGSPGTQGRKRLGGPDVPYGHLWRTGANEPTTIRSSGPLTVAGIPLPGGNVSLYTVPGPETWEIILNRATKQWGHESQYTEAVARQELGRTIVPADRSTELQDRLTFSFEPSLDDPRHGMLVLRWETTTVKIPLAVAAE